MELTEIAIETYHRALDKLVPILQKRSKRSYIGVAVALVVLERIYSFFRVPKSIRHIPAVPYFAMAKSFLTSEAPSSRHQRIVLPVIEKGNGIYVNKLPLEWTVNVATPTSAKHVLLKSEIYPKSESFLKLLGPQSPAVLFLGGKNVGFVNGDAWRKQRKIMNPAFHRSMPIQTMASVMPDFFSAIDKYGDEGIPISTIMRDFTLDVLGHTAFGFDFKALKGDPDNWTRTYHIINDALFNPTANMLTSLNPILSIISPERRRILEAIKKLNGMLEAMIKQKRQEVQSNAQAHAPENEKDLLTLMLEAQQRGEGLATDEELKHNVSGFFLAGHDTTSETLSFYFYNIAKNKDVQRKLREELNAVLGDKPVDVIPTLEQLKSMEYLNCTIKENLRLNGPADNVLPRVATEDMVVDGTPIPKGTVVNVDIHAIHHDTRYWKDPYKFVPERFLPGGEHDSHSGMTWLPFGNGARQCLGMNFSLAEQRLVIAMTVRKYDIEVPKDSIHYDHPILESSKTKAPASLKLIFRKRY
ncbi:hypothetical protein RMCBS344292_18998 [Rhizopus microsporus]|nr:hypothetical protein RMCBS344292_18998 [Rhizopus microsporus]